MEPKKSIYEEEEEKRKKREEEEERNRKSSIGFGLDISDGGLSPSIRIGDSNIGIGTDGHLTIMP